MNIFLIFSHSHFIPFEIKNQIVFSVTHPLSLSDSIRLFIDEYIFYIVTTIFCESEAHFFALRISKYFFRILRVKNFLCINFSLFDFGFMSSYHAFGCFTILFHHFLSVKFDSRFFFQNERDNKNETINVLIANVGK